MSPSTIDETTPDEELAARLRDHAVADQRAFELLLARHKGHVVANCRHIAGRPDEAEDLAQEVFVKAYFGLRRFEGRARFRTWLTRIKVNHCLNHLRRRRIDGAVDVTDPAAELHPELQDDQTPEVDADRREFRVRVAAALDGLPETLRVPLVLCDVDGYSYQEIAGSLGIGLSATKMRIKRGREAVRAALGEIG